jgi:putative tryptophan/tyrosine transport system substrate-binding protein
MNTRRRWLAAGAAWPALAWTGVLHAQANPPVIIGWLETDKRERSSLRPKAFHEGMAALGWKQGAQYVLEERYAEGRVERLAALAQEIAATRPAVILANGSSSAKAATAAAPTTPIVLSGGDPLTAGLVTSLARPGGLITGVSSVLSEAGQKAIELLVEAMPKLRRVGFLVDSTSAIHSANVSGVRQAAERFRVEPVIAEVAKPEDIEPAFAQLAKAKVQALVIVPSPWFGGQMTTIIASALVQRLPAAGTSPSIPRLGGLFSFGPDSIALARRSASYVDRILKGAKPGDLPIEQPTTFNLILNLKTAKALGITIAPSLRVRATEVIE